MASWEKFKLASNLNQEDSPRKKSHRPGKFKNRSVLFSRADKRKPQEQKKQKAEIDIRSLQRVNDNAINAPAAWPRMLVRIAAVAILGGTCGIAVMNLNMSNIAYQAMIHMNDKILMFAMEISPNSVAYAMNEISPE